MTSTPSDRDLAQRRFEAWVAEAGKGAAPEARDWIAGEREGVQAEFLAIVEDYRALQEGRPSDSGLGLSSLPGPGQVLGEYQLIRELGRGGMGAVWEAEQLSLQRRVALKLLHPLVGLSPRALERFRQEASVTARLSHPNLVQVYATGEADGTPFLAQELIPEGRTLEQELREENPDDALPSGHFRDLALRFAELAEALAVAHEDGVIHRDLKPSNILLAGGRAKLADFGLARVLDDASLSVTGELLGTPAYMSPEQVAGERQLGPASDQFSFGATLYEALTLQRAFPGDTREQIAQQIRYEEPADPRKLRSRIPPDLATICMKALRKLPHARYASMRALAGDLRAFADGRAIQARPLSTWGRVRQWVRRRPAVSSSIALALFALVGISYFAWDAQRGWGQAEKEAEAARLDQQTAVGIEKFLIGVFASMGPAGELGADASGRDLLTAAEEHLLAAEEASTADLGESPVARAGLWVELGILESSLGEHERAERFLRRGLALYEQYVDGVDQRTLRAHNQLAHLLVRRAKFDEAEEHYLAAQAGHDRLYGAESDKALENQGNLAFLYWRLQRFDEAAPLLRNSLRGMESMYGPDHFHTWTGRSNLAALLIEQGDGAAAEPIMQRVVEHRERQDGPRTPAALAARLQLANAVRVQEGRAQEAIEAYAAILEDSLLTYGPVHPNTASTQHSYGVLLAEADRPAEAEPQLRQAWLTRRSKLRPGHPSTAASLRSLRTVWKALGRDPDAEQAAAEKD